ncbi:GH23391 [Drosophila grimshawi]|uniref:GH23391 n=1 Tax=Drosophila grimshawi TaxID=7222 RepID=B4K2T5_DROGR|nr:GH23391 [Drosophila grimshawi]
MMKTSLLLPLLGCMCLWGRTWAHRELADLLVQQQKDLDLSTAEVDALRPFYRELQAQHDYLYSLQMQNGDGSALSLEQPIDAQLDDSYAKAFEKMRAQFIFDQNYKPSIDYDTKLPSLEHIIGQPSGDMTEQELQELEDLLEILQDAIDESQLGIDQLVRRAIDMEINLLKLNKPKIVTAAIAGLEVMWHYWGRASRAAYCSYSHVPQFTEALHAINGGVDCYVYTMGLIQKIQDETVESVKEIKHQVQGLVKIYKKIAAKKTLMGKILSGVLNVFSALRRVHDIIAVGIAGYDKINNQLPGAVGHTAECGLEFANSIPQMTETAHNLTVCITFVDTDKPDYDFTKPEGDRYWNTGATPGDVPHENDVDEDDDDADNDDDDYVDHR